MSSRIDFIPLCIISLGNMRPKETKMTKLTLAATCVALLVLSSCSNTAYGLKRDGQNASAAMDDASHKVLSTGAKK